MSWLSPNSLINLKSQLSELTRDVIQETDVDRSLLESRIAELAETEDRQKGDIENLMRNNLTMQDRVDAAELQAATVSKEFRNIIVSLQEELSGVKLENRSLKDLFREQSYAAGSEAQGVREDIQNSEEDFKKQISDLEIELQRQAAEHSKQIISLNLTQQTPKKANKSKGSGDPHSHDERGRGDGVDVENGRSSRNEDAQLVELEEIDTTLSSATDTESNEVVFPDSLEIRLTKERAHKERLLKHLEEISTEHDKELLGLIENNSSMREELEVLRLRLSQLSAGEVSEREFNSVSTQTLPLRPQTQDRPPDSLAESSFMQGGEIGWLKDEVKNLTSKLRSSSLEAESLTRERETKQKVLQNLQLTVRQLERENTSLRSQSVSSWRDQLHAYRDQSERLSGEVRELRARCEQLERERGQQLTASDVYSAVTAGGREMSGPHEYLEAELLRVKAELYRLVLEKNEMVRRDETRALLIQYITAPLASRGSALQALSTLLDVRAEERDILKNIPRCDSKTMGGGKHSDVAIPHKSLSQLFIEFLMQESSPQPSTESMGGDIPVVLQSTSDRDRDERPSLATATLGPTPEEISKAMFAPLPNSAHNKSKLVIN